VKLGAIHGLGSIARLLACLVDQLREIRVGPGLLTSAAGQPALGGSLAEAYGSAGVRERDAGGRSLDQATADLGGEFRGRHSDPPRNLAFSHAEGRPGVKALAQPWRSEYPPTPLARRRGYGYGYPL